jgi:phosphorylase kinase alpha/beta subunit
MPHPEMASAPAPAPAAVLADPQDRAWTVLRELDRQIEAVVLSRQHPISGLLPASTANTVHGNYGDAWVRDCVYSIQCVWGLALAHRRLRGASRRVFELEQRVLQLMRGLLHAMARQAPKVERFKHSLHRLDAIHAKFDTGSGSPVVPDDGWGHLPSSPAPAWWWCAPATSTTSCRTWCITWPRPTGLPITASGSGATRATTACPSATPARSGW